MVPALLITRVEGPLEVTQVDPSRHSESGQAGTEFMLAISVVVIAVVAMALAFVPSFSAGVNDLATDVERILRTHEIGEVGSPATNPMNSPSGLVQGRSGRQNPRVSLPFQGMLSDVKYSPLSAMALMLSLLIAGIAYEVRNSGQALSAAGQAQMDKAMAMHLAQGGTEADLFAAYSQVAVHNGDVRAAHAAMKNGGVSKAVLHTSGPPPSRSVLT